MRIELKQTITVNQIDYDKIKELAMNLEYEARSHVGDYLDMNKEYFKTQNIEIQNFDSDYNIY